MTNHLFDGLLAKPDTTSTFAIQPDGTTHTYGDLLRSSARYANAIVARGIKPGDRVAAQLSKSLDVLFLYLGCIRAGAVFLPLNTAYTATETGYFIGDATPGLIICDADTRPNLEQTATKNGAQLATLKELKAESTGSSFENTARNGDDLAAILYTSGTTGRSKGAMLTHENLLSNAQTLKDCWQFSSEDTLLHALPIFHTHGLFVATNTVLAAGASMMFMEKFDTSQVIQHLDQCTSFMGVPTFYTRLLSDHSFTKDIAAHMRIFISGSAPLLPETHARFEKRTGHRILERYGMTETNMNTSNPYQGSRRAGTVGFALPDVSVRICDAKNGTELEQGEIGVLEVKGPNVFAGYWKMPDKTREEFREDGYFITGDLALVDADGYIHIVGRSKDLIISGGFNIYPKELELLFDAAPGVLESAIIGVPHPDFGEAVVAVVVASGEPLDPSQVMQAIVPDLARFKHPKSLQVVPELPRNSMGKVQKNILREQFKDLFSASQ